MEKKVLTWQDRVKKGPSAYPRGIRGHQLLMLDDVASRGFEVQFERKIFKHPYSSSGILKDPTRMLIGYTKARVYVRAELEAWRGGDRKQNKPKPLREATLYCSASDQFNRRVGNIRATAKVMRAMGLSSEFAAPLRAGKKLARIAARERKKAREAARAGK
jgi:hypothetical protein